MYSPDDLSFAPLYQCNLECSHCVVPHKWNDGLDVTAAIRLLG